MENRLASPQRHLQPTPELDWSKPLVTVRCTVYNHEPYVRDALEGFLLQETTFPFEVIVHDDASTDNSASIVKEYAEKYPHILKPIYQTENQFSKGKDRVKTILDQASNPSSIYWGICEGDDYWTDPLKLQTQVDFMESHPDYSMCAASVDVLQEGKPLNFQGVKQDITLTTHDAIVKGGGYFPTLTLLYRKELLDGLDEFREGCSVGDYPLQIFLSTKGKIMFLSRKVGVYRFMSVGSWTSRYSRDVKFYVRYLQNENKWLDSLNNKTHQRYNKSFRFTIGRNLYKIMVYTKDVSIGRFNLDVFRYVCSLTPFKAVIFNLMAIYTPFLIPSKKRI